MSDKVFSVVSKVFSISLDKITDESSPETIDSWDSFNGLILVDELVEKPGPDLAPSLLGIQGRYVFTPDLFDCLKEIGQGKGGEMQLTDAMQILAKKSSLYSWTFNGRRYDIGTMKDWFQSHLELSASSDFSHILHEILEKL